MHQGAVPEGSPPPLERKRRRPRNSPARRGGEGGQADVTWHSGAYLARCWPPLRSAARPVTAPSLPLLMMMGMLHKKRLSIMLMTKPSGDPIRDAEWNWVHSADALLEGVKLALLLSSPVPRSRRLATQRPAAHGPVLLSYPQPSGKRLQRQWLSVEEFLQTAKTLKGKIREVLLPPRPALPNAQQVEQVLKHLVGFQREIPGQITGFWFGSSGREVPSSMPGYFPTGAVLPPHGKRLGSSSVSLDLVPVDYVWFPLSEVGAYSYDHSADLIRQEERLFVPCDSPSTPWPTVYVAKLERLIEASEVAKTYGRLAWSLVKDGNRSVELRLTRRSS